MINSIDEFGACNSCHTQVPLERGGGGGVKATPTEQMTKFIIENVRMFPNCCRISTGLVLARIRSNTVTSVDSKGRQSIRTAIIHRKREFAVYTLLWSIWDISA